MNPALQTLTAKEKMTKERGMNKIHFVFGVHNHQPVGNFDNVFEKTYQRAYKPFLDVVKNHGWFRFCVHNSGPLMEWLEPRHPEYFSDIAKLVRENRVELVGGGYYEPILPAIPEKDRTGQITLYSEYLEKQFKTKINGIWTPERVWEQSLVSSIANAGCKFTVLDDFLFKAAGLRDDGLNGYYFTEDSTSSAPAKQQRLNLFPISEELRYSIPFKDPQYTIDYLRNIANSGTDRIVVYMDDGEKFGGWPKTKKHVYDNGWLEKFLQALGKNRDWIEMTTFSEALEKRGPMGRIYLPGGSYREMTEWVLPVQAQHEYEDFTAELKHAGKYEKAKPFVRGSIWKNFLAKYPETANMHAKMRHVSALVDSMNKKSKAYPVARRELYRGQCNCPYWHGVFGGLYLPYLRHAVFEHLLEAEKIARKESVKGKKARLSVSEYADFDNDGNEEIHIANGKLGMYAKPALGGCVYELDYYEKNFNLLNTLARYPEAYHRKLSYAVLAPKEEDEDAETSASIHDMVLTKELGLEKKLRYDRHIRASFIDHFFPIGTRVEDLLNVTYEELGDFYNKPYTVAKSSVLAFERESALTINGRNYPLHVRKEIALSGKDAVIQVKYTLTNTGTEAITGIMFGSEMNFAFLAGDEHDRYYKASDGEKATPLRKIIRTFNQQTRFGIYEGWRGFFVELEFPEPTNIWVYPVETVSMSEGGFESIYQSSVIMPVWELNLMPFGSKAIHISKKIDALK
ncbi:MAG: DUF1926 domain-containing protein [Planctomycetes bacterium]|nr:DUF1926 domain-containing protein [Planctomycetota bacterium]